ncbi:MAG: phage major capsid protein [Clostridiales bacterium]|nr:phage major capsid protein [Clostridiales bacterium]
MPVRMSNEMREILNDMNAARAELNQAISDRNVDKAKEIQNKITNLNTLYDAAEIAFQNERRAKLDPIDDPDDSSGAGEPSDGIKYDAKLFYKAITDSGSLTEGERAVVAKAASEYKNRYSEGSKDNGGYTVPDDLSTEIFESIKSKDSVRNLVGQEAVTSASGTRIYKTGEANRLYNTEEYGEIREMNNSNYGTVKYNQKKFAAILPISTELLEDSVVNFTNEITGWLSEAARITENRQVLYGAGGEKHCQGIITTPGAFKEISSPSSISIDFLRKVKFSLDSGYRATSKWVMNTDAFLSISELKDNNGRSYIQEDPKQDEGYILLGKQIYILDDIETEDNKTVIMFGDLTKAYRLFDRRNFGIAFTDIGAGAFETDTYRARGIERFDGKIMDNNALVIVRDFAVSALDITEPETDFGVADTGITSESLSYQNKNSLIALAEDLGVAGINSSMTKSAIITAILTAVNGEAKTITENSDDVETTGVNN